MVAAEAVASSEAWKPAREFRRLAQSWEGCEAQQAWTTHREQSSRFKVSQEQGNLRSCNLARSPLHRGAGRGGWGTGGWDAQSHQQASSLLAEKGGPTVACSLDSSRPMVVPRKTVRWLC